MHTPACHHNDDNKSGNVRAALEAAAEQAQWQLRLPLDRAKIGENVYCTLEPSPENDALFTDWECPLIWKWVSSRLKIDAAYRGQAALRFNFARRTPEEVWKTNWTLWYDTALVTRALPPDDLTLRATLTFEEVVCGFGSDNNHYARPWTGIVARMVDLRRHYYYCLEYPDQVVLYRREDNHWTCLARRSCELAPFEANTLELRIRGQWFEGYLDGQRIFGVADYAYASGRAGLRASSESFVTAFELTADVRATRAYQRQRAREAEALASARAEIRQAVVQRSLTLAEDGQPTALCIGALAERGTLQMLYALRNSTDGATLVLRALDGSTLWRQHHPLLQRMQLVQRAGKATQDVLGFTNEAIVLIDGQSGEMLLKRSFASLPNAPQKMGFLPNTQADLHGTGLRHDFLFTSGANDPRIWALDGEFRDIWQFTAGSGMGHDNSISVADIDGDGVDEVFAGGSLIDCAGGEIWRQAELLRRLKAPNAGHVDASQMGYFCEDPALPVVHMQGSSAGHLVADARDGSTLIEHAQGHVQGGCLGQFVPGERGLQIAASCRHGNYGILAIYAGDGRRLARFQPDYRTDCPTSIRWDGMSHDLILLAHDPARAGLYDWQGRCLVPLSEHLPRDYRADIANADRDYVILPAAQSPSERLVVRIHKTLHFIAARAQ